MATRSTISIENLDGTVTGVYCHWDGYVSHNGRLLYDHYPTEEQARALISLGHISLLAPEIGDKHPFDNPYPYGSDAYKAHQAAHAHMTTFYGRDRGEQGKDAETYPSLREFIEAQCQEFDYHFKEGRWFVSEDGSRFLPLECLLKEGFTV